MRWKTGSRKPCTLQRVATFVDSLGYRETTLKDDTETAIIAFRNRVAEVCKAEVTIEDAVKGDKQSNGLIENTVMLICGIHQNQHMSHWHQHTRTTQGRHANAAVVGITCRMHPVQGLKKVVTGRHHSSDCMARKRCTTLSHLVRKYWRRKSPRIPKISTNQM